MNDTRTTAAVTGIGFISPAGMGLETFYRILGGEASAEGKLETYNPDHILGKKGLRFIAPASQLMTSCAHYALEAGGADAILTQKPERVGLYHGTEIPNLGDSFG